MLLSQHLRLLAFVSECLLCIPPPHTHLTNSHRLFFQLQCSASLPLPFLIHTLADPSWQMALPRMQPEGSKEEVQASKPPMEDQGG